MNSFEALSWHALIIFRIYDIEVKLDSVSYNRDKNLQRRRKFVGERDFPIQTWSSSMSESQQGPEICDVINAKPYLSPHKAFHRALFFRPFRPSLAPTICPWVSEDEIISDTFRFTAVFSWFVLSSFIFCQVLFCLADVFLLFLFAFLIIFIF